MAESEPTVWCVRAGRRGEADSLFLQQGYVALGWTEMGDMSRLPNNAKSFREVVHQRFTEYSPGAVAVAAGQLRRFVYDVKPGDLAVYSSKIDRQVHIARIVGPYFYNSAVDGEFSQLRKAEWLRTFPRSTFSDNARYEMGSLMTLFQIKTYAHEIRAALVGGPIPPTPQTSGDSDGKPKPPTVERIEEYTRDFLVKRLAQELKGHPLADFVAHLLTVMGYRTRVSPPGPDRGVDIIANRGELGFEPPLIKVQVKSTEGSIGGPIVNELYGTVAPGEYGLLVTLGGFTAQARDIARTHSNLRLIDGDDLIDLILLHYDQFDARYKGILPLKRVYMPDLAEETEIPEEHEG